MCEHYLRFLEYLKIFGYRLFQIRTIQLSMASGPTGANGVRAVRPAASAGRGGRESATRLHRRTVAGTVPGRRTTINIASPKAAVSCLDILEAEIQSAACSRRSYRGGNIMRHALCCELNA